MVLMLAGSFSCRTEKGYSKLTPVEIGTGIRGVGPKQDLIITSQVGWENLIMAFEKYETDRFSETEIDFDNYMVIAIIDEVRPSTGWSIYIKDITEYSDKIIIIVDIKAPQGIAADMLTKPYYIAKIPVTAKSIEFKHINK